MSYIPFARKYRPQKFNEVVGQEGPVRILKNAIKSNRVAHAYIFAGPRGVGKTTIARILAKSLNCLKPEDGEPCGVCENCQAIAKGHFPDLIEIDAASNRGIDDIRQLKESVSYAPIKGNYKVYIIDEAHMLTKEAFNALLKTLEEPPPRTVFVLCTTELDKIIPTIQSRCQRIIFKKIPNKLIVEHLKNICEKEGISYEDKGLEVIANTSEGCMRDAASILDQAAIYCNNHITEEKVREFLGIVSEDRIQKFLENLINGNTEYCLEELKNLDAEGYNLTKFWEELYGVVFNTLLQKKLNKRIPYPSLEKTGIEQLLYLEQLLSKALAEAKFKEPLNVFQLAVIKADLVKDIIPLGELLKLVKYGKPIPVSEAKEKNTAEVLKKETKPSEKIIENKTTTTEINKTLRKREEKTKIESDKKGTKVDKGTFINKLIKDEIIESSTISLLSKYLTETDKGLILEIPKAIKVGFAKDLEKIRKYYGKYVEIRVKEEVSEKEKKFKKMKDTPYLF
jgi:DNA polymerase-3 subunit gamma/tau